VKYEAKRIRHVNQPPFIGVRFSSYSWLGASQNINMHSHGWVFVFPYRSTIHPRTTTPTARRLHRHSKEEEEFPRPPCVYFPLSFVWLLLYTAVEQEVAACCTKGASAPFSTLDCAYTIVNEENNDETKTPVRFCIFNAPPETLSERVPSLGSERVFYLSKLFRILNFLS